MQRLSAIGEANYNVVRTVFGEDFVIGEGIQQGLATGVNEHFVIGQYEAGIQLAQRAIDDALEGRLVCPETKRCRPAMTLHAGRPNVVSCWLVVLLWAIAPSATAQPNIVLIVAEDLSPRVGAFGDAVAQTPNIDALAEQGMRYTQCFLSLRCLCTKSFRADYWRLPADVGHSAYAHGESRLRSSTARQRQQGFLNCFGRRGM